MKEISARIKIHLRYQHVGYGKHDPAGRNQGNSRNGVRTRRC
jgi:hypothetical protein